MKNYSYLLRLIYFLGDLILLNLSFFCAYLIRFQSFNLPNYYLLLLIYFNIIWVFVSFLIDNYNIERTAGYTKVTKLMLQSAILHLFSVTSIFVFIKTIYFSRLHLGYHYLIFIFLIIIWRRGIVQMLRYFRAKGINQKNFVIIGRSDLSQKLVDYFRIHPEYGYQFKGFFTPDDIGNTTKDGRTEIIDVFQTQKIHEVYCVTEQATLSDVKRLRQLTDEHLIRLKMLPDLKLIEDEKPKLELYGEIPVLLNRKEPLDNIINQFVKRTFDIIFATMVLVFIASWLFPLIGLLIKVNSKGPIFFIQNRRGKNFEFFPCYKFRTMYVNNESDTKHVSRTDSRITKIGSFLRKTNLDEFPQFLNVLNGDMSIVGPRPNFMKHSEEYSQTMEKYMLRHLVKPGITGLAQVKGHRGVINADIDMKHRVMYDIFYIENWSFFLDVKIIFLTTWTMLRGDKNAF